MMKLSLMHRVVDTVDENWRSPLAEQILARWEHDPGTAQYYRASANFIFIYKNAGKLHFLRFNERTERAKKLLEAELELLHALDERSLRVSRPVKSLHGREVEEVQTEWGTFYAVVFEALSGEHPDAEELRPEQYAAWGKELGKLHQAMKALPEELSAQRPSWRDHLAFVSEMIPPDDQAAREKLGQLLHWASTLPTTKENFGLIHYDFELDNLRFAGGEIGILDFDDCSRYWYVADLAYALRDLFEAGGFDRSHPLFLAFLSGYRSATQIDPDYEQQIQQFYELHNLVIYAKLLRAVDLSDSQDHPEWLANLNKKLVAYRARCHAKFASNS